MFQSSFELTGYITMSAIGHSATADMFQSSFELMGYITIAKIAGRIALVKVSKLFRAYGLYNYMTKNSNG